MLTFALSSRMSTLTKVLVCAIPCVPREHATLIASKRLVANDLRLFFALRKSVDIRRHT